MKSMHNNTTRGIVGWLLIAFLITVVGTVDAEIINLTSELTGSINGVSLTGTSTGTGDTETGSGDITTVFTQFPTDFIPVLSRSWHCVHHKEFAPCASVLFNRDWDGEFWVTYGVSDTIYANVQIRQISPNHQHAVHLRTGEYHGSLNILKEMPYTELLEPLGPGKISVSGTRRILLDDGNSVYSQWTGTVTFLDGTSLSAPLNLHYNPVSFTWNEETLTFTSKTNMDCQ